MDLRFKLYLQLLVAANILGVEEDLRDGGFARPLLQPRPHPGGEPVHAHLHVLEVLILQTLLGGQTVGTPGDGVDCDPAQLAHDQSQLSIHRLDNQPITKEFSDLHHIQKPIRDVSWVRSFTNHSSQFSCMYYSDLGCKDDEKLCPPLKLSNSVKH